MSRLLSVNSDLVVSPSCPGGDWNSCKSTPGCHSCDKTLPENRIMLEVHSGIAKKLKSKWILRNIGPSVQTDLTVWLYTVSYSWEIVARLSRDKRQTSWLKKTEQKQKTSLVLIVPSDPRIWSPERNTKWKRQRLKKNNVCTAVHHLSPHPVRCVLAAAACDSDSAALLQSFFFGIFFGGRGDPQRRISGTNGHIHIDCIATQFVVVMPMM